MDDSRQIGVTEVIELDEDGWQIFPGISTTSTSETKTKSSNRLVGNINSIRREWWNTPPPLSPEVLALPDTSTNPVLPSRPLATLTPSTQSKPSSVVAQEWELIDPNPDIHSLFALFNATYFWNKLGPVTVAWSSRMTNSAGICSFRKQRHYSECRIKLSLPLLKLRQRRDLVETLLHEMIHAYLFLEPGSGMKHDRDGHGPNFQEHMHRINRASGANITIYHSFHDEVRHYQQHWWQCTGTCRSKAPYFGIVRRTMNRPPGPNDRWWSQHAAECNGTYVKVKEPKKENGKENKKRLPSASATYFGSE